MYVHMCVYEFLFSFSIAISESIFLKVKILISFILVPTFGQTHYK